MTLIKDISLTKIAAAFVAVAMMAGLSFAVAAERAHAVTLSELVELFIALDIIPDDKADEARAALANQTGSTGGTTGGSTSGGVTGVSCNFTRDLGQGSTGADVKQLQQFLNSMPDTKVAVSGAGSAGMETMYYGPATAAAVSKFQMKYSADILAPLGLTKGTGYFGAASRAKARTLCSGTTPTPTPGDDDDDDTTGDDDDDDTLEGGEASLENYDSLNSPSNEDVQAGDEEVEVFGFEFDVEDADVEVRRVDVRFEAESDASYDAEPWEYFEEVSLLLDGDVVATAEAGDEDDWEEVDASIDSTDTTTDAYELRFTDLSEVINEGENPQFTVAVTMKDNLDSDQEGQTWNVWVGDEGVRARDGAGIDQYIGGSDTVAGEITDSKTFDVEVEGEGEELTVSLASSNPDASVIRVDDEDETDDQTVFVFNLEAEENDIEVTELPIHFDITGDVFNDVVSEVMLEVDGVEYDDYTTTGGTTADATTTFEIDGGDLVVEADDEVEVKVIVTFNQQSGNFESGDQIQAELRSFEVAAIEAEGSEDVTADGSASGDTHTLMTEGVFAEVVSVDGDSNIVDGGDDTASFTLKFDLTAFEDDFYIAKVATGTATTASGVVYAIQNDAGTTITTGTRSAVLTSTADTVSGEFVVREGETETFTVSVTLDPATQSAYYRVQLVDVNFASTTGARSDQTEDYDFSPSEDFRTDYVYIGA